MRCWIDSLGDVGATLKDAKPESLERLYRELRLELKYQPHERAVDVQLSPRVVGACVRGGRGRIARPVAVTNTAMSSIEVLPRVAGTVSAVARSLPLPASTPRTTYGGRPFCAAKVGGNTLLPCPGGMARGGRFSTRPAVPELLPLLPGGFDALPHKSGLVREQHPAGLAQMLDDVPAQIIAHPSASQLAPLSSRCIPSGVVSPATSASVHPFLPESARRVIGAWG
jgi:hypothetical protein